jgi:rubrerythrin
MAADIHNLATWTEDLGLRATVQSEPTGDTLRVVTAEGSHSYVKPAEPGRADISCQRRVPNADVQALWGEPDQPEEAAGRFAEVVGNLGNAFPLLAVTITKGEKETVVDFESPLHTEGLNRQAYALTVSGVMKAAETFDMIQEERSRQTEAWASLEEEADATLQAFDDDLTACPQCGAAAEAGDRFCGSCGHQLVSQQGGE